MNLLITLAWRNLWRNRRRTIITIAAVVFAVFFGVIQRGMQKGTYEYNIDLAARRGSGHVQVQHKDYLDSPTLRNSFRSRDSTLRAALQNHPLVLTAAERILAGGLLSANSKTVGTMWLALDVEKERKMSNFGSYVHAGRFLNNDDTYGVVLGYKLMQNLGVQPGDTVVALGWDYSFGMRDEFLTVLGSIKTGEDKFDRLGALLTLGGAREILGMHGRCSVIAAMLPGIHDVETARSSLTQSVQAINPDLRVRAWDEVQVGLKELIELDDVSSQVTAGLLLLVVSFGILNTILMSITERFREFGIMLALGMQNSYLTLLVLVEILLIFGIGVLLGNALGAGVNMWIAFNPIELGGDVVELYREYGFAPQIHASLRPDIFTVPTLAIVGMGLLMSLIPLVKTWRLKPLKGIRYT